MSLSFVLQSWAAFAPGLNSVPQWQAWARQPWLPAGDELPELREMPALARRRLSALGRLAVQVAWWAQEAGPGMPVVFASRYGDAARSLELLAGLARGEALSPTAFGLSVHNAIGALYSIARDDRSNHLAVAAGCATAAAALVEAAGLLADGAPEVLVVCYDAPLPGAYAGFADEAGVPYAWAWRIAPRRPGQPGFSLEALAADEAAAAATPALPFGLDVLRFALSGDAELRRAAEGTLWRWSRHG